VILSIIIAFLTAGDQGFVPLYNGKDLTGWKNVNCAPSTWQAKGDVIYCSGKPTGVLRTQKMYQNFIMECEWRHLQAKGNAGIFVWSDAITAVGQPFTRSVEVQVMDGLEDTWYTSDGDIFPIHGATMKPDNGRNGGDRAYPTEKRMKPSPEWNHYRIECVDGTIKLAVNGKVVTSGHDINPRMGYICLESEGSPVEFRSLKIKEMPSPRITPTEISKTDEGFVSLYNGVDFTGWKYQPVHEGHFRAEDWTITFDGGGDDLWSEKSYKDFTLIVDWRWTGKGQPAPLPVINADGTIAKNADGTTRTSMVTDAGDSGIYLRGNSKSQVNIWCWPIGSGEVYGYREDPEMSASVKAGVTPKVNADRPIGEWNRFIITMKGDRLTVVLNGKTVLENAQLPGVPESGPIALQHHGGAIQFANIYIKEH